jgi:hypothetical protein
VRWLEKTQRRGLHKAYAITGDGRNNHFDTLAEAQGRIESGDTLYVRHDIANQEIARLRETLRQARQALMVYAGDPAKAGPALARITLKNTDPMCCLTNADGLPCRNQATHKVLWAYAPNEPYIVCEQHVSGLWTGEPNQFIVPL